MASRMSRSMAVRLARASKQPRLPQPHFGPPICMMMCPISPADSRSPRHNRPLVTNPAPMPVPTQMSNGASGLAGGAEPGLAVGAQVAVVADGHGHVEAGLQVRADRHAREAHVRRDHDIARLRLDDARHGDADGRQVGRFQLGLVEHFAGSPFRSVAKTFSGPPVRGVDCRCLPRMIPDSLTKRGLNLRAADINAQIKPLAIRFRFHHELPLLVTRLTGNCTHAARSGTGERGEREMGRAGDREMGRAGDGESGRWGEREMGRAGDRESGR